MKRNATQAFDREPAVDALRERKMTTGMSYPLGATVTGTGANFSLFSRAAARVELLFFDRVGDTRPSRIVELDPRAQRTYHYWHAFVPRVR
jgi:isoamylase